MYLKINKFFTLTKIILSVIFAFSTNGFAAVQMDVSNQTQNLQLPQASLDKVRAAVTKGNSAFLNSTEISKVYKNNQSNILLQQGKIYQYDGDGEQWKWKQVNTSDTRVSKIVQLRDVIKQLEDKKVINRPKCDDCNFGPLIIEDIEGNGQPTKEPECKLGEVKINGKCERFKAKARDVKCKKFEIEFDGKCISYMEK